MARLTKQDWLDHGLRSLATEGFTSLKADVLAKSLGVSRGSFYWHFSDLAEFHSGVLHHWLDVSVRAVVADLGEVDQPAEQKLALLIETAASASKELEQAVRAWAFNDPSVREVVARVDRERTAFIADLIEEIGATPELAQRRAMLIYMSAVGYNVLGDTFSPEMEADAVVDLVGFATG